MGKIMNHCFGVIGIYLFLTGCGQKHQSSEQIPAEQIPAQQIPIANPTPTPEEGEPIPKVSEPTPGTDEPTPKGGGRPIAVPEHLTASATWQGIRLNTKRAIEVKIETNQYHIVGSPFTFFGNIPDKISLYLELPNLAFTSTFDSQGSDSKIKPVYCATVLTGNPPEVIDIPVSINTEPGRIGISNYEFGISKVQNLFRGKPLDPVIIALKITDCDLPMVTLGDIYFQLKFVSLSWKFHWANLMDSKRSESLTGSLLSLGPLIFTYELGKDFVFSGLLPYEILGELELPPFEDSGSILTARLWDAKGGVKINQLPLNIIPKLITKGNDSEPAMVSVQLRDISTFFKIGKQPDSKSMILSLESENKLLGSIQIAIRTETLLMTVNWQGQASPLTLNLHSTNSSQGSKGFRTEREITLSELVPHELVFSFELPWIVDPQDYLKASAWIKNNDDLSDPKSRKEISAKIKNIEPYHYTRKSRVTLLVSDLRLFLSDTEQQQADLEIELMDETHSTKLIEQLTLRTPPSRLEKTMRSYSKTDASIDPTLTDFTLQNRKLSLLQILELTNHSRIPIEITFDVGLSGKLSASFKKFSSIETLTENLTSEERSVGCKTEKKEEQLPDKIFATQFYLLPLTQDLSTKFPVIIAEKMITQQINQGTTARFGLYGEGNPMDDFVSNPPEKIKPTWKRICTDAVRVCNVATTMVDFTEAWMKMGTYTSGCSTLPTWFDFDKVHHYAYRGDECGACQRNFESRYCKSCLEIEALEAKFRRLDLLYSPADSKRAYPKGGPACFIQYPILFCETNWITKILRNLGVKDGLEGTLATLELGEIQGFLKYSEDLELNPQNQRMIPILPKIIPQPGR